MANKAKIDIVSKNTQNLTDYPYFLILSYGNSTHQALENLRKQLKKQSKENPVVFSVIKNNLLKIALTKYNQKSKSLTNDQLQQIISLLTNQTAVCYIKSDYLPVLSTIYKNAKENENITFKIGYLDKIIYDSGKLNEIAQLPSFDILVSQFIGRIKAPHSRFVFATKFNISKLTYILKNKTTN